MIVGSRVVVEVDTGWLGLDLASGNEVWRRSESLPSLAFQADRADGVLFACDGRECAAILARDGTELWRTSVENPSPPGAAEGFVFVVGFEEQRSVLVVVHAASGQLLDTIEAEDGAPFSGRPAYGDGRIFVKTPEDIRGYRYP